VLNGVTAGVAQAKHSQLAHSISGLVRHVAVWVEVVARRITERRAITTPDDWPRVFPKVWGILGWNIYVYHTHLDVTPPVTEPPDRPVAWHQDSMRANEEMELHPRPRLSLKAGYYLSDVTGPDWGNTLLLADSHLQDELDCP
jgi:hypothetical protein